jgi:hypothetical protein
MDRSEFELFLKQNLDTYVTTYIYLIEYYFKDITLEPTVRILGLKRCYIFIS